MTVATVVDSGMQKLKIYSPGQIAVSSILGGPCAVVFVLWKNFQALDNDSAATQTLAGGGVLTLLICLMIPFLPEKFPNYIIPLAYMGTAISVAQRYQLSKKEIVESERYEIRSNWNVLAISLGSLVGLLAVLSLYFFLLTSMGVIGVE